MRAPALLLPLLLLLPVTATVACVGEGAPAGGGAAGSAEGGAESGAELGSERGSERGAERVSDSAAEEALRETLARSIELADSMEDLLRPVRLMTTADEEALRRYSNAANVERARRLGARPADRSQLESYVQEGRLVRLADSTQHWVLWPGRVANPYVTPDTHALLERLGERFQSRLEAMGLPLLRFEISSVLRTAAGQAALRQRNPNAAAGTSAHEFGTTVDIPYVSYAAPAELPVELPSGAPSSMRPELERVAREVIERMAARKSRELQAILGDVMREAQAAGEVLVTLERLQPVYHITVAKALASE